MSSIAAGSRPTSTGSGLTIFSTELISSSTPMTIMSAATARPEMYSILPWPKGWSGSGFLPERRKPSSDIADAPASERLLNASAVMAIEPESAPAAYFPANSSAFRHMPSTLHSVPYALRTVWLVYSVGFLMKIFASSFTMLFNSAFAHSFYYYLIIPHSSPGRDTFPSKGGRHFRTGRL